MVIMIVYILVNGILMELVIIRVRIRDEEGMGVVLMVERVDRRIIRM